MSLASRSVGQSQPSQLDVRAASGAGKAHQTAASGLTEGTHQRAPGARDGPVPEPTGDSAAPGLDSVGAVSPWPAGQVEGVTRTQESHSWGRAEAQGGGWHVGCPSRPGEAKSVCRGHFPGPGQDGQGGRGLGRHSHTPSGQSKQGQRQTRLVLSGSRFTELTLAASPSPRKELLLPISTLTGSQVSAMGPGRAWSLEKFHPQGAAALSCPPPKTPRLGPWAQAQLDGGGVGLGTTGE